MNNHQIRKEFASAVFALVEKHLHDALGADAEVVEELADEVWNAGVEAIKRVNEAEPIPLAHSREGDTRIHVEKRGGRSLVFASAGEREAALGVLREWRGALDALHSCGKDLADNGRSLSQYGGWEVIEGRIRETVGMELMSLSELLKLKAEADKGHILLADLEELRAGIDRTIERSIERSKETLAKEAPEELQELAEKDSTVEEDPEGAQNEASARLEALTGFLQEIEAQRCIEKNIRLRQRVLQDIARCESELQHTPRKHDVLLAEHQAEMEAQHNLSSDPRVRITAHEGKLVIEVLGDAERGKDQDGWYPKTEKRWGSKVCHTKARLEASPEAIEIMRKIPRNNDAVGDLMWDREDGVYSFSWWGPVNRIIDPWDAEASRDFRIWPGQYIECENNVPPDAIAFMSESDRQSVSWRNPIEVP